MNLIKKVNPTIEKLIKMLEKMEKIVAIFTGSKDIIVQTYYGCYKV